MLYKKIIYILLFSLVVAQSQFNYFAPEEVKLGDARSMGIGNSYLLTSSASTITSINPAKLSYLGSNQQNGIIIDFQLNQVMYQERRSQIIMDNWEEHLNYADNVFNQHYKSYTSMGVIYNIGNFGIGISNKPLKSLNYSYEEEVRSERNYPDGYVGMKDPITGYQVFKSRGSINLQSFGVGYSIKIPVLSKTNKLSIGLSHNYFKEFNVTMEQYIDTLHHTFDPFFDDNFDNFIQDTISEKIEDGHYNTIGVEIPIQENLIFALAYEDNNSKHILFGDEKKSIGMKILSKKNMLMALECSSQNDLEEYKVGFEYTKKGNMPLRMGFNWTETPDPLDPISTLTIGTGKKIRNLDIDFGLNYKIIENSNILSPFYLNYIESYSIENFNIEDYIDSKVTENNLSFLITFKWSL